MIRWLSQNLWALITGVGLYIFHDKDKEKVSHLNSIQTVNIDVIPNTKDIFSSS